MFGSLPPDHSHRRSETELRLHEHQPRSRCLRSKHLAALSLHNTGPRHRRPWAGAGPGIVDTLRGGHGESGRFAVATVNVGTSASITASADTGSASLPVSIALCQTNPDDGRVPGSPADMVTTQIDAGQTPTFGIFVTGTGAVPFDPANNRVFVPLQGHGRGDSRGDKRSGTNAVAGHGRARARSK